MEHSAEHCMKILKFKKIFFLKSFVISFLLYLISVIILVTGHEPIAQMVENVYGLSAQHFMKTAVILMGFWKILIIQFTLVPFIVLALMEKCKCHQKEPEKAE